MAEVRQRKKENDEKQEIAAKLKKRTKKDEKSSKVWLMRLGSTLNLAKEFFINIAVHWPCNMAVHILRARTESIHFDSRKFDSRVESNFFFGFLIHVGESFYF